jgi:hypothetical protein
MLAGYGRVVADAWPCPGADLMKADVRVAAE